jgi:hypothetical protein
LQLKNKAPIGEVATQQQSKAAFLLFLELFDSSASENPFQLLWHDA